MVRQGPGMGRETAEIRKNIAGTREEIDTHLQELGGRVERVQAEYSPSRQARENLPQVLGGAAIAGLFLGFLVGHGNRSEHEARQASREWRRLARERGRLQSRMGLAGFESEIP